jgi:hypothetical protein
MIAPEPTAPQAPASGTAGTTPGPDHAAGATGGSGEPLTTLRGAGVQVDIRRAGRVAVILALVTLAAITVVLFVAGAQKNAQIASLHANGVPVEATVAGCLGLMGGSGSNLAGYECSATYSVDGHRYTEGIPGNADHAPGSILQGVTVPGDPALFSTPGAVASERPSAGVFLVPSLLLVALVLAIGAATARRRRLRRAS